MANHRLSNGNCWEDAPDQIGADYAFPQGTSFSSPQQVTLSVPTPAEPAFADSVNFLLCIIQTPEENPASAGRCIMASSSLAEDSSHIILVSQLGAPSLQLQLKCGG